MAATNHPAPVIDDAALAEMERVLADSPCATFPMTTEEARALCQTVRAAWKERQEAREAAFREAFTVLCPDCAEGDEPEFDEKAKWYYHDAGTDHEVGCSASKLRLEAAANSVNNDEGEQ